jgi:hypothetical protein
MADTHAARAACSTRRMKKMRKLLISAAIAASILAPTAALASGGEACFAQAKSTPQWAALAPKMALDPNQQATIQQLSDLTTISPNEASMLTSIYPYIQSCIQTELQDASPVNGAILVAYNTDDASDVAALLQRQITFGQYNSKAATRKAQARALFAQEQVRQAAEHNERMARIGDRLAYVGRTLTQMQPPPRASVFCTTTMDGAFARTNCN